MSEETKKRQESGLSEEKAKERSGSKKTATSSVKSGSTSVGTDPAGTSVPAKQNSSPAGKQGTKKDGASDGAGNKPALDEDIRIDADGNKYVQASMQFDEEFEIMEFD